MNKLMRAAAVSGMVALVFGCATPAQRQYKAIVANTQNVAAQAKACFSTVYASPEAAPLRGRMPFDARDTSLAQLADSSLATKTEIQAILVVAPRWQQCEKAALQGLMTTTPSVVPIYAAGFIREEDNLLALAQRKETWGQFSRKRRDNAAATDAQVLAEGQRLMDALREENENELLMRAAAAQAAGNALMSWSQNMQAYRSQMTSPSPIRTTHCNWIGNSLNCNSY
jgi:hypothetical protein